LGIVDLFVFLRWKKKLPRALNGAVGKMRDPATFPRVIYIYWDKGLDQAPEITEICVQSWIDKNPGWQVRKLDRISAAALVDMPRLPDNTKPAHYADILRTGILRLHGGVWADATAFCHLPLDNWLPMIMGQCDFFAFARPAQDRIIANWFLAARPQTRLIAAWHDRTLTFWRGRKRPPISYFWHHDLFEWMLLTTYSLRQEWAQTPQISVTMPHLLQRVCAGAMEGTTDILAAIQQTPVHKLTYKRGIIPEQVLTILDQAPGSGP
jgi:mannosyltransferase OCH1-like enzyme